MPRYILAFIPTNPELVKHCVATAQNFSSIAQGYMLGDQAQPHVTVCHFDAEHSMLAPFWAACSVNAPLILPLHFDGYYAKPVDENGMLYWLGFSILRDHTLITAQRRIIALCAERQITTHTLPNDGYFPHLTLARVQVGSSMPVLPLQNKDHWAQDNSYELSIGLSSPEGRYISRAI
jgi:2'-5' RNA ligase